MHRDHAAWMLSCAAIALGVSIGCSAADGAQRGDERRTPARATERDDGGTTFDDDAAAPAPAPPLQFDSLDRLLESCPSPAEVAEIHADFDIVIDESVLAESRSIHCSQRGRESSAALSVDTMFRAMRLIRFDRPLPLIGATNLYEWFKSTKISVHVFAAPNSDTVSHATETAVHLNSFVLSQPYMRRWVDRRDTVGLQQAVALLLHEARHTISGGNLPHDCNGVNDSSVAYGGAWALQYDFDMWLAEHVLPGQSGLPLISAYERSIARRDAAMLLSSCFCSGS